MEVNDAWDLGLALALSLSLDLPGKGREGRPPASWTVNRILVRTGWRERRPGMLVLWLVLMLMGVVPMVLHVRMRVALARVGGRVEVEVVLAALCVVKEAVDTITVRAVVLAMFRVRRIALVPIRILLNTLPLLF